MSGWFTFFNLFKTCGNNEEGCYGKKKDHYEQLLFL